MAQKKITALQLRASVTDDLNVPCDDGIQSYRTTAAQWKAYLLPDLGLVKNKLATVVQNMLTPTGQIAPFAGSTAPSGWVLCDGKAYARTGAMADLFATISTNFGAPDGTTFNVPDLRGQFLRGVSLPDRTGSGTVVNSNGTFTGHGYNRSGIRIRFVSGTVGGVSYSTDYWTIYVDDNTLAFATTYANALAGVKVALSGANSVVIRHFEDGDSAVRLQGGVNGATTGVGTRQVDAIVNITGDTGVTTGNMRGSYSVSGSGAFVGYRGSTGHNAAIAEGQSYGHTFDASRVVRTASDVRPNNVAVNYIIKI